MTVVILPSLTTTTERRLLLFYTPHEHTHTSQTSAIRSCRSIYFDLSTMAVKEKLESSEDFEWNVESEIQLFLAMNGHKPVGVNKYFHMVCIWEKFRAATHKDVSLKPIWDHLESMYDLMALDDTEELPFPSNEVDFVLPDAEFLGLMKTRKREEPDGRTKEQRDKSKDLARKDKELKETPKKELPPRDQKTGKEAEKKKEEVKKLTKEPEVKKEKLREAKDVKKDYKTSKSRPKGKDEADDSSPMQPAKKERKDSGSSRDELKRVVPKRPTRQSIDNTSKASSSPRDTPPPKRRRI